MTQPRLSNGEQILWAAAFTTRLNDMNESFFARIIHAHGGWMSRGGKKAVRDLARKAVDFADIAVDAARWVRKDMSRKKQRDTSAYKNLLAMLKG